MNRLVLARMLQKMKNSSSVEQRITVSPAEENFKPIDVPTIESQTIINDVVEQQTSSIEPEPVNDLTILEREEPIKEAEVADSSYKKKNNNFKGKTI
jgi:hypothetical protein